MRVTTNHSASSYGVPVILDADGKVMGYPEGVKAVREFLGLSIDELAAKCGVSKGTVYNWQAGRMPEVAALNVMGDLCRKKKK